MRHPWRTYYLLFLIAITAAVVLYVLSRGRAVAVLAIVIALFVVAGPILAALIEGRGPVKRTTKNVTPHEPALPPGGDPPLRSAAARGPEVIVIEPPNASDRLAAKLEALERLRADGLVTELEYEAKRAQLIADF